MHSGSPAARKVNDEFAGNTLHRRSLVMCNLYIDFHIRLATSELGSPCFASPEYLQGLGAEFGGVDAKVYEEFAQTFLDGAAVSMRGRAITKTPVLYVFSPGQDVEMYKQVGKTRLYSLMRFMMGEFCVALSHVVCDVLIENVF